MLLLHMWLNIIADFKNTPQFYCGDELNLICHPRLGGKPRFLKRGGCHIISLYDGKLDSQFSRVVLFVSFWKRLKEDYKYSLVYLFFLLGFEFLMSLFLRWFLARSLRSFLWFAVELLNIIPVFWNLQALLFHSFPGWHCLFGRIYQ